MPGGFVGRRSELQVLQGCAADVQAGHPRLVFVEGPAGIGKTALLAEFAPALVTWRQLTVSGDEAEMRLPYGLLSRLLAGASPRWPGWPLLAGPTLADPFTVGAQLVQLLGDLQESGPVAVIVDDAPWGDPQSVRALAFALRRLHADRVLTVLTMRTEDAARLPPGLLRLGQDQGERLQLVGLNPEETRELGATLGSAALSRRAAERLCDHSGGNPLHLRALFEELPDEELRRPSGPLAAPASFGSLALAAMADCPEPGRRLLTAAAVLGVRSPLAWAAAVGEVTEPLEALESAARTNLVEARSGGDGWVVAFRHALIHAAVYDDLGPASRSRLHERAAAIVNGPDALSHRLLAAGDGPDPEMVALLVAQAGRDAPERPGRAADWLLAARRLSPEGAGRDGVLLEAVGLLLQAGEVLEAAAFSERIAALPDTPQRRVVQAQFAWMAGRHDEAEALAVSVWEVGVDTERAAAAVILSQARLLRNDSAGAARWAERAMGGIGIPAQLVSQLVATQAAGLALSGQTAEGLRLLDEQIEGSEGVPVAHVDAFNSRGLVRMVADDLAGARADFQACLQGGGGWRLSPHSLTGLAYLAEVEYRLGNWDDSLSLSEQALSFAMDTDQTWLFPFVHAIAVFALAGRGIWHRADEHARAAMAAATAMSDEASRAYAANAAVHLAACRGDAASVVAAAEPFQSFPPGTTPFEPGLFEWAEQQAAALVTLGRLEEAQAALDRLGAVAEQRGRRSTMARVARVRGELATARREPAAARAAFEESLRVGRGFATALDQAMTHAAYGRFLRRAGERRAAGDQLRIAQDGFRSLGAQPFLDRCNAELAACGLAVDRTLPPTDAGLTTQERAVARLICAGRSNREAAEELVLSVKTVGYHLGNAYSKLGVNSRTQLAAVLGHSPA